MFISCNLVINTGILSIKFYFLILLGNLGKDITTPFNFEPLNLFSSFKYEPSNQKNSYVNSSSLQDTTDVCVDSVYHGID